MGVVSCKLEEGRGEGTTWLVFASYTLETPVLIGDFIIGKRGKTREGRG